MEPRLWILIQAFAHLLPPGDVIDAGANDGADSSRFARLFDQRTVLAIEPTVASTRHIMKTYVERQGQHNIEVLRAGLGEAEGSANYSALLDHRSVRSCDFVRRRAEARPRALVFTDPRRLRESVRIRALGRRGLGGQGARWGPSAHPP